MEKQQAQTRTYGYARVSTEFQNLDHQLQALREYGCYHIFEEKQSGRDMKRRQMDLMKLHLQRGDTLVVTRLDRLGRNVVELEQFVTWLEKEGITLHCIQQPLDFKSANGRMMFRMHAAFAQMESELTSERTKRGMEAAKKNGKQIGSLPKRERWEKNEPEKAEAILQDIANPRMTMKDIRKKYNISALTLRRNWSAELKDAGKISN